MFLANSIFVYKGKAYIAGVEYGNAFYSIDGGEFNYLPEGVEANSVFVNNDDVYIAGSKYDAGVFYPMLWKNRETITLPLALQVIAKSVFVLNEDVYMTGADITGSYIATYWLNGIKNKSQWFFKYYR